MIKKRKEPQKDSNILCESMITDAENREEKLKQIKQMFSVIPPDYEEIEKMLSAFSFDKKELAEIAVHIVDSCFAEKKSREFESERYGKPIRPFEQCFSNYVYNSLKLLLRYGYDPNVPTDDDNAMFNLQYIDYPDIGAKTLRLLLKNGGNPNVTLPDDSNEGMYDYLTSCISYDSYEHEYADRVKCWWVLMGYGAGSKDGKPPIEMLNNNSIELLKNFENYDYCMNKSFISR